MTVQLTRYGAQYLATQGLGDHSLNLKLYNNPNNILSYEKANPASFEQPISSSGYTNTLVGTNDWFVSYAGSYGSAVTYCTANAASSASMSLPYSFVFDGATPVSADNIYGYCVTINDWPSTDDEYVLWAESFNQPFEITDTGKDHIDMVLQMEFK